jgi:hypothetical protein
MSLQRLVGLNVAAGSSHIQATCACLPPKKDNFGLFCDHVSAVNVRRTDAERQMQAGLCIALAVARVFVKCMLHNMHEAYVCM